LSKVEEASIMLQFRQGRMAEKERFEALLKRQPVDRIPFDTMATAFAATMVGYSKVDVYEDPEKCFWAQLRTNEMFGAVDDLLRYNGGAFPAREFGGDVKMPTSQYAMAVSLLRPAVQSEEDVLRLEVPDVKTAGTIPLTMQFSKLQAEHGLYISFMSGSILTLVGFITGVETMCRWMIKKPWLVHRLCRIVTDLIVAMAEYWVDTFGPEHILPSTGAPTEANQVISPKQFEEFCLPYQKEVHEKLFALGVKYIWTHICGEQNLNLPLWAQIPMGDPGIVSFGHEVDLDTASQYFPNDIIQGNVEPAVIQTGTPEEVYELSRICIEKGKKHFAGFILSPGCEMPAKAPPYNVWMMIKAINDFGWYA
jgi:uroporphyrinogen decarboxylase